MDNRSTIALVLLNSAPGCTRTRYQNCVVHGQTMYKLPRDAFDTFYPILQPDSVTYVYKRGSAFIHILVDCATEDRKRMIAGILRQLELWFIEEELARQGLLQQHESGKHSCSMHKN